MRQGPEASRKAHGGGGGSRTAEDRWTRKTAKEASQGSGEKMGPAQLFCGRESAWQIPGGLSSGRTGQASLAFRQLSLQQGACKHPQSYRTLAYKCDYAWKAGGLQCCVGTLKASPGLCGWKGEDGQVGGGQQGGAAAPRGSGLLSGLLSGRRVAEGRPGRSGDGQGLKARQRVWDWGTRLRRAWGRSSQGPGVSFDFILKGFEAGTRSNLQF